MSSALSYPHSRAIIPYLLSATTFCILIAQPYHIWYWRRETVHTRNVYLSGEKHHRTKFGCTGCPSFMVERSVEHDDIDTHTYTRAHVHAHVNNYFLFCNQHTDPNDQRQTVVIETNHSYRPPWTSGHIECSIFTYSCGNRSIVQYISILNIKKNQARTCTRKRYNSV